MNTFVIHYHNFLGQLQSDFPHLDISAGHNRTQSTQALIQLGVLVMTLFAAIIGGALTGNIDVICTKVFYKECNNPNMYMYSHNQHVTGASLVFETLDADLLSTGARVTVRGWGVT